MKPLVISLPLPPRFVHPNGKAMTRGGEMQKRRETKACRKNACEAALVDSNWARPKWIRAAVAPTFYFKDKRRRDGDGANASLKAYIDGIADAGIVANDSGITLLPPVFKCDKEKPRVVLSIVELKDPAAPEQIVVDTASGKSFSVTTLICKQCGNPMQKKTSPGWVVCHACNLKYGISVEDWEQMAW